MTAADKLHMAIAVMLKDWRDGDFDLPSLAIIHMTHVEEHYRAVGRALKQLDEDWEKFQREVLHPNHRLSEPTE